MTCASISPPSPFTCSTKTPVCGLPKPQHQHKHAPSSRARAPGNSQLSLVAGNSLGVYSVFAQHILDHLETIRWVRRKQAKAVEKLAARSDACEPRFVIARSNCDESGNCKEPAYSRCTPRSDPGGRWSPNSSSGARSLLAGDAYQAPKSAKLSG